MLPLSVFWKGDGRVSGVLSLVIRKRTPTLFHRGAPTDAGPFITSKRV